jgi:hypothetical protein
MLIRSFQILALSLVMLGVCVRPCMAKTTIKDWWHAAIKVLGIDSKTPTEKYFQSSFLITPWGSDSRLTIREIDPMVNNYGFLTFRYFREVLHAEGRVLSQARVTDYFDVRLSSESPKWRSSTLTFSTPTQSRSINTDLSLKLNVEGDELILTSLKRNDPRLTRYRNEASPMAELKPSRPSRKITYAFPMVTESFAKNDGDYMGILVVFEKEDTGTLIETLYHMQSRGDGVIQLSYIHETPSLNPPAILKETI